MKILQSIMEWYRCLKGYQRRLVIMTIILVLIFWTLVISDIGEWWNWKEWEEHIRLFHM